MAEASEYRDNVVQLTAGLSDRPGGGGLQPPGGGGVEARLARVEADLAHAQRDLTDVKTDVRNVATSLHRVEELVARLDERIKILPGKGFIVTVVIVSLSLVGALVTYSEQIRSALHR